MTYKITVLYDEKTKQDALDTFEDVQTELAAWKIPFKATNGKIKKVITAEAETSFVFYEEDRIPEASDILYTTDKLRKKVKNEDPNTTLKFICHTRPFQDLVNIVIEMKQLHDMHIPIIEATPLETTASESL